MIASKIDGGVQLSADYVRLNNRFQVPNHEGELTTEKY